MVDILHGTREDGALGFFTRTVGYYPPKLVDPFVDVATTSALDFFLLIGFFLKVDQWRVWREPT
jgi:hypothetical protein